MPADLRDVPLSPRPAGSNIFRVIKERALGPGFELLVIHLLRNLPRSLPELPIHGRGNVNLRPLERTDIAFANNVEFFLVDD